MRLPDVDLRIDNRAACRLRLRALRCLRCQGETGGDGRGESMAS
jgi:hypothetical protein